MRGSTEKEEEKKTLHMCKKISRGSTILLVLGHSRSFHVTYIAGFGDAVYVQQRRCSLWLDTSLANAPKSRRDKGGHQAGNVAVPAAGLGIE